MKIITPQLSSRESTNLQKWMACQRRPVPAMSEALRSCCMAKGLAATCRLCRAGPQPSHCGKTHPTTRKHILYLVIAANFKSFHIKNKITSVLFEIKCLQTMIA